MYHVLNRGVARLPLFEKEGDYAAFERVMEEAHGKHPLRLLAYCLMPNHWHFVCWPQADGDLTAFFRWLTHTHTMRWHAHHHTGGTGHLYQDRFKAFPVQEDDHFYSLLRYVERNAYRAHLVAKPEDWRWCSLWRRTCGDPLARRLLSGWPLAMPRNWREIVAAPQNEGEVQAIRRAICRGFPYGSDVWQKNVAVRLGLESTLRPRGRPKKVENQ